MDAIAIEKTSTYGEEAVWESLIILKPGTTYKGIVKPESYPCNNPVVAAGKAVETTFTTKSILELDNRETDLEQTYGQAAPKDALRVLPNPNNGTFTLLFPSQGYAYVQIVDATTGKEVYFRKLSEKEDQLSVQDANLVPGYYYAILQSAYSKYRIHEPFVIVK